MVVRHIERDEQFSAELEQAGAKLAVVDFFATWCGPCQRIAPKFEELSQVYPQAVFLKVDVDKCPDTAQSNNVTAMPTFAFFVGRNRVDVLRGADPQKLESKVKQWAENTGGGGESAVPGQLDLLTFVSKKDVECLNESDDHTLQNYLNGTSRLESDCDEQLIINFPFSQPVKVHSIIVKGPADRGPKTVKLFINQPNILDFDKAQSSEPVQKLEFTESQVTSGEVINLRYVKFQNVQNIQLFVQDNLTDSETTRIDELKLFGTPIHATNMQDFKRVAGKKGEAGH